MTGLTATEYVSSAVAHSVTLNSDDLAEVRSVIEQALDQRCCEWCGELLGAAEVSSEVVWDFLATAANLEEGSAEDVVLVAGNGPVSGDDLLREFHLPPGARLALHPAVEAERRQADEDFAQMMRDQEWDYRHA